MPPYLLAVVEEAWENSWNSLPICSGVIPMPVSATESVIQSRPFLLSFVSGDGEGTFLGELVGITRQVEQRLPEAGLVGVDRAQVRWAIDDEAVAVLDPPFWEINTRKTNILKSFCIIAATIAGTASTATCAGPRKPRGECPVA